MFSFPFSFSFHYFKGYNATEEIQLASNYSDMRVFTVARIKSDDPLYDLPGILENWPAESQSKQAVTKIGLPTAPVAHLVQSWWWLT